MKNKFFTDAELTAAERTLRLEQELLKLTPRDWIALPFLMAIGIAGFLAISFLLAFILY